MGCDENKEFIVSERKQSHNIYTKKFEEYIQLDTDNQTYTLYFYKLLWKTRPIVCFYQLKEQEKLNKREVNNLNSLLKQKTVTTHNNFEALSKDRLIIYYIHCSSGAIITRNSNKINYYLSNNIDNVIDICLIDISNIYMNGGDKFNIYEVKNQSKYFFNLNMKEIDFSNRNQLIDLGKQERIAIEENIEEDEELEEKTNILKKNEIIVKFNKKKYANGGSNEEKDSFFQIKNTKEKEIINKETNNNNNPKERKSIKVRNSIFKGRNSDLLINQTNTKELSKNDIEIYNKRNSIFSLKNVKILKIKEKQNKIKIPDLKKNILNNACIPELTKNKKNCVNEEEKTLIVEGKINNKANIIQEKMERSCTLKKIGTINMNDQNILNLNPIEIVDNCLIIKGNKFGPELNKEIEEILYESVDDEYGGNNLDKNNENYSPYDHIIVYTKERSKKRKNTKTVYNNKTTKINYINAGLSNVDNTNSPKDKKTLDYIIIHNRFKTPFELRTSKNIINKIILAECDFSAECLFYLKEFIDMLINYKNLLQIKIYQNQNITTSFVGWKLLKKLFSENFYIRWVSLKNGYLDDRLTEIIISSMILKRIRYLNISNNNITNKAMYHLNKFLIKNQTLSVLYMSKNPNITINGIRLITNALQMHPNILKLDISHMNLEGGGIFFSSLLNENKCLQELNLRNTNLSKNDIVYLASKLINEDSRIISLDIGLNSNIGDEGLKEIGKIIYNNRSLKSIGLDGLNLSMNNYLPIFEAICKNRTIETYSLNMNSGLPFKGILNFFLKNPQVKEISITPWDIETEFDQKFTQDQLYSIEKFHLKAPHVNIRGIIFVETEEFENNNENK